MMKEIIDQINSSIDNKIAIHEKHLTKVEDEKTKQFIKGCIAGLNNAKLSIPLKETVGVKCEDV